MMSVTKFLETEIKMTEQNLAVIEVKDLIPVAYIEREKFFLNENNEVQTLIDAVKNYYSNVIPAGMTADTEDGRKTIKKFAAELNNKIKEIDNAGKSITDILKAKPKLIDAGRKVVRDELSALYEEIRKPVVLWEAEQARIKAEEDARIAEEQRKKDEELERLRKAESDRIHEEALKQKAIDDAKRENELAIARAKQEAEAKVKAATDEANRIKAEVERKEQQRIVDEKRKADEEAKRLADISHVKSVKNGAFNCLINHGIDRESAIKVITLICEGKVDNVSIKY
ncbi:MAG: hypothetical protein [Bacteriophage sp.]|nr:MAG: hypothetical protein [Bacteriophage sp.]